MELLGNRPAADGTNSRGSSRVEQVATLEALATIRRPGRGPKRWPASGASPFIRQWWFVDSPTAASKVGKGSANRRNPEATRRGNNKTGGNRKFALRNA